MEKQENNTIENSQNTTPVLITPAPEKVTTKHTKKINISNSLKKLFGRIHLPLSRIIIFLIIFSLGIAAGYLFSLKNVKTVPVQPKDKYYAFLFEVYDTVKENYWDKITDDQLSNIYKLGSDKVSGLPQDITPKNKADLEKMFNTVTRNMNEKQKKEYSVNLANVVLANLNPFGRSGLFTQKDEENLKNKVENKDPNANLYKDLGVKKESSKEEIKQAYAEESQKISQVLGDFTKSKEEKDKASSQLAQISRAYDTLANENSKQNYDQMGVETTIVYKLIRPDVFYIKIKQLSPLTFDEFQKAANSLSNENVDTLILDVRGNIGGAIDVLPYFLGMFIGQNQYAYEFFHKGDTTPFKTKISFLPSLYKFKKVITLTDNQAQSSAEVMAATFKKYNVGVVLGTATKGWGTVERVFSLKTQIDPSEKYSMFLVHSLTLRDDGQPIEGKGVDPTINISDPGWEKQLYSYYHYPELATAIKELLNQK